MTDNKKVKNATPFEYDGIVFKSKTEVLIYKTLKAKNEIPEGIEVVQIQATTINGRVKINVKEPNLSGKFIKIDLYSEQGLLAATKYVEITDLNAGYSKDYQLKLKGDNFVGYS